MHFAPIFPYSCSLFILDAGTVLALLKEFREYKLDSACSKHTTVISGHLMNNSKLPTPVQGGGKL